jgi:hypothetical protein
MPSEKHSQQYERQREPNGEPDQRAAEDLFGAASVAQGPQQALPGSEKVKVDFSGVSRVTHSFADEVFGSLTTDLGLDVFRTRLEVVGISNDIQALLRFVVSERIRRPTH